MSAAKDNTSHGLAFLTNFTASLVLAAFVIAPASTHGYQAIDLDTSTWNVACTIVGTAVGLFTTVAFSMQDDIITRRELASDRGVRAIETIMGQVSEGYISLLRQSIERTTINGPSSLGDLGAEVRVFMTVTRMGGSHIAGTAVFGVLLLGTLSGTVRACVGRRAVSFEAQDPVRLLSATNLFQGLKDTSVVAFRDGIELLDSPGSQSPPYGEVSATPKHVGT
ncbi:hypothetical protein KVT40_004450 [Elsinoe batatas]|uniref:Uncharacterized protein n=1 Tax=Elsinoe batatas TaxID=2601811 RepID=A0A8K0PHI6_9PEZI|nr:hypothetical protein KVT40_004450 [Elsinoe batatas]